MSKAEIFREKNDLTLAILNYSQAIKCRPKDADLYFKRGEMYELTNKLLAIDDFSKVSFMTACVPVLPFIDFCIANILFRLILRVFGLQACMGTKCMFGTCRGQNTIMCLELELQMVTTWVLGTKPQVFYKSNKLLTTTKLSLQLPCKRFNGHHMLIISYI